MTNNWKEEYKKAAEENMKTAPLPQTRHGLNINILPDFEYSTIDSKSIGVIKPKTDYPHFTTSEEMPNEKAFFDDDWKTKEDNNVAYEMHQAFANQFLTITVPKDAPKVVELDYLFEKGPVFLTILIKIEPEANSKVILNVATTNNVPYLSVDTRTHAQKGSKTEILTIQNASKETSTVQRRIARIENDAQVDTTDFHVGSSYTLTKILADMRKPGATSNIKAIFLGTDTQKIDLYTESNHNAPHTYSDIVTRGVLNHKAKGLSRGLIRINQNANDSNGYETQECLLLSSDAEADAIPNLEIHNPEVKCSHGSTIGQVDSEQLFYLMSRGMPEEVAKLKIIEGYFMPALESLQDPTVRERIHTSLLKNLGEFEE